MSSKHTPGPWAYQEDSDAYTHIVRGHNNRFICQLAQTTSAEIEANARLIAAAPELLMKITGLIGAAEYLQARVVETRGADCMDNLDVAIDEARAAIAKATGGAL
ncbi:TPA: hypothetical protein ACKPZU_000216 [Stenotrophomonas maltophilia]